jgi:hypothetical protein
VLRIIFAQNDLAPGSPFRYAVYRRAPGSSSWTPWLLTRLRSADYRPDVTGEHEFAMRIRNVARGWHTGPGGDSPTLRLRWDG